LQTGRRAVAFLGVCCVTLANVQGFLGKWVRSPVGRTLWELEITAAVTTATSTI
jgi:hypothetical protein